MNVCTWNKRRCNVAYTKYADKQKACTTIRCTDTRSWTFTHTFSLSASLMSWHILSTPHRVGSRLSGTSDDSPSLCGHSHDISLCITPSSYIICSLSQRLRGFFFKYWMPSRPEGSLSSSKKRRPVYHRVCGVTNWFHISVPFPP